MVHKDNFWLNNADKYLIKLEKLYNKVIHNVNIRNTWIKEISLSYVIWFNWIFIKINCKSIRSISIIIIKLSSLTIIIIKNKRIKRKISSKER